MRTAALLNCAATDCIARSIFAATGLSATTVPDADDGDPANAGWTDVAPGADTSLAVGTGLAPRPANPEDGPGVLDLPEFGGTGGTVSPRAVATVSVVAVGTAFAGAVGTAFAGAIGTAFAREVDAARERGAAGTAA